MKENRYGARECLPVFPARNLVFLSSSSSLRGISNAKILLSIGRAYWQVAEIVFLFPYLGYLHLLSLPSFPVNQPKRKNSSKIVFSLLKLSIGKRISLPAVGPCLALRVVAQLVDDTLEVYPANIKQRKNKFAL